MGTWIRVMLLSVGGALGVNARFWLGYWMNRWASPQFPWATFTINVSGSFAIGFLATLLERRLPHPNFRLLVIVGFLGGYTTFSTFAYDSLALWERGEVGRSLANMIGSVLAGIAAVALGVGLARASILPNSLRTKADVANSRPATVPPGLGNLPANPEVEPGPGGGRP